MFLCFNSFNRQISRSADDGTPCKLKSLGYVKALNDNQYVKFAGRINHRLSTERSGRHITANNVVGRNATLALSGQT